MKGEIETRLERGIEAAKAGEEKRARDIFIHIIELDQYNEQAWLWLSAVVETTADKIVCLENVLFINPRNASAASGLQHLHQETKGLFAPISTLPRLDASQALDEWDEEEDEWKWAGESESEREREREREWEWDAVAAATSPTPTGKVCPRCNYRNPGWVLICDRCGNDLQPVDLRAAISSGSKPRGRSFFTLVEAWGGAFIFNRFFAYQPEIELASWGRSLAALILAVLFASAWRATTTLVLRLAIGAGGSGRQIANIALRSAVETLPSVVLLMLICVPIALLTWVEARLVGGRQSFKTHAHLTTVAFSSWIVLIGLLAPLVMFVPHLLGSQERLDLPFLTEALPIFISVVVGLTGNIWLAQALQTAHRLSDIRAFLAAILMIALSVAFLIGVNLFPSEWLTEITNLLAPSLLP